jgi:DMSO/TMAO reductase YedYZ molybdopterin-dependent catalytic subunit
MTMLRVAGPAMLLGQTTGEVIPWLDQPPPNPDPASIGNMLRWEELESWYTPTNNFFYAQHFGQPAGLNEDTWRVEIAGLVAHPRSLTMADIKRQERHEVDFTLECSGNDIVPGQYFQGAVGNARWTGARLASLLEQADILENGSEVIFWGLDRGQVTIRDNYGVTSAGRTGVLQPRPDGGSNLIITEQFARGMSVRDAIARDNLLCYQMNGDPLPPVHGFPVRLIAPGWYGVANVKWLTRIEVVDSRYAGNFMVRGYVSIHEQQRDGQSVWTFLTVGHDRLKSAAAKVTRANNRYTIMGAAWGAPIAAVEVQIDGGSWSPARLTEPPVNSRRGVRVYSWRFWTFEWGSPTAGEHMIRSRAYDTDGNVQPATDEPFVASRRTYWENNAQVMRRIRIPCARPRSNAGSYPGAGPTARVFQYAGAQASHSGGEPRAFPLPLYRDRLAQIDRPTALADVVAVPAGNLDDHIALHHRLAAKPGMQRQPWRHVETVLLVVIHLGKIVVALLDDDVAGCARTASAAGVFQMDAAVLRNVEQRFRLSVPFIRQFAGFELERDVVGKERNLWH